MLHVKRSGASGESVPARCRIDDMKTLVQLEAMKDGALLALVKTTTTRAASAHLELGKALVVLDKRREAKGTLKRYVREETGIDVPDHAFCCAVVFGAFVASERITEAAYDAAPLRWLLTSSAIHNGLDKAEHLDDDAREEFRRQTAEILATRPEGGQKLLDAIKAKIRKPAEGEGGGEGEGEGEPEEVPGVQVVSLLNVECIKTLGKLAAGCEDRALLESVAPAVDALREIIAGKLEVLTAAPVAQPVAA